MKNIKFFSIMTAIASMIIVSNSKAKLSGAYVGLNGVNVFSDILDNAGFRGSSAIGNMSNSTLGGGVEVGYNYNIDNILIGGGLSYIYAAHNYAHVSDADKSYISPIDQGISGNRINLDINVGYVFEDKVALTLGGIISYNPGKPKYTIAGQNVPDAISHLGRNINIDSFDKKTTSDFGFGFKVGTNIKLTESLSFDLSYRMTWFATSKDYQSYIEKYSNDMADLYNLNRDPSRGDVLFNANDIVKVSKLSRVDKMLTFGIRFNF